MYILQIEHQIRDFATWKAAFERDPASRQRGGVRRYRVLRPIDDSHYVKIDLEFDSADAAERFRDAMRVVWQSPSAAPALASTPQARIAEVVERTEY